MLPRKTLSVLAGAGLLLSSVAPAFAQTGTQPGAPAGAQTGSMGSMTPQAQAADAIRSFCTMTASHWSEWGYSSVAGARDALGNNQSDWYTWTLKLAGMSGCPTAPVAAPPMTQTGEGGRTSTGESDPVRPPTTTTP